MQDLWISISCNPPPKGLSCQLLGQHTLLRRATLANVSRHIVYQVLNRCVFELCWSAHQETSDLLRTETACSIDRLDVPLGHNRFSERLCRNFLRRWKYPSHYPDVIAKGLTHTIIAANPSTDSRQWASAETHKKSESTDSLFLYATYRFPIQEAVKLAATAAMPASMTARLTD